MLVKFIRRKNFNDLENKEIPSVIYQIETDIIPKIGDGIITDEYNGYVETIIHNYAENCVYIAGDFTKIGMDKPRCVYNHDNICPAGYDRTIGEYCSYCSGNRVVERGLSDKVLL